MTENTSRLSTALADRYRIESRLGEGGMATVYLAEDLKHDRKVAVKVLRPDLAAVLGAERFVQEIKTTAALQHPHILPLYDSGEADGFLFYVMPYVQGETLRDKLNRETQVGIDEAVKMTVELADALHHAHQQGVIHRDIKPENILIQNGRPMVADFGIALAVSAAAGGRMTETGLSLGTPHYMSPEQATAEKELSARSDVYSLASVLYEMLTGDPPHTASSAQAIIMKIVTDTARPVTDIRKSVPPHVAAAVAKALEKLPADRFASAAEFGFALTNPAFAEATAGRTAATSAPSRRRAPLVPALAATTVLFAAIAAFSLFRGGPPAEVSRLDLSLGGITLSGGEVAISADGRMLAAGGTRNGEQAIYVRRLGEADFQKVPGTEGGRDPSFSPDGEWLVFRSDPDQALVRVAVSGGGTLTLVDGHNPFFPHWGADGTIAFAQPNGTWAVDASGGEPRRVAGGFLPHVLPDGSGMLLNIDGSVHLARLDADSTVLLIPDAGHASYVETGHLVYVPASGGLFAVPFDLGRHAVTGTPVRVLDRVAANAFRAGYRVSRNGTLVHHEGAFGGVNVGGASPTTLVVGQWDGSVDTLRLPPARRANPRLSPDGRSVAFESSESGRRANTDIYTFDLVTNTRTQITFDGDNDDPVWSPDGTRILYNTSSDSTDGEDLWIKPADNSAPATSVLRLAGDQWPVDWPAEDRIVFASEEPNGIDLFVLDPTGNDAPEPYLQAPWNEWDAAVSPDQALAAHTSNKNGFNEIWVRDFPVPRGEWLVSPGRSGGRPRWSPDAGTLYFLSFGRGPTAPDTIFAAPIDRSAGVVIRAPEPRFVADMQSWDLHPDGEQFIVALVSSSDTPVRLGSDVDDRYLVVLNWFSELQELTGR